MRASEHPYAGMATGDIIMPTTDIPCNCACVWIVVRAGQGKDCLSRLKYRNALCQHRHKPPDSPPVKPARSVL